MNDMRAVIIPKSDQMNADDLLGGPITITVARVEIRPGTEQPVSIYFDGDNNKPYKPCKSMARVMVNCWGPDANAYVGRSMTLYCDPKVMWGGVAIGGIRISHLSHIEGTQTMALTATKGSRKPFTVKPLAPDKPVETTQRKMTQTEWLDALEADLKQVATEDDFSAIATRDQVRKALAAFKNGALERLNAMLKEASDRVSEMPADEGEDQDDQTAA